MKMSWFFQFMFLIKTLKDLIMDLLLLINDDKSHYVYIKDFNTFMFHKTKNEKLFCRSCLQCLSSESVLIKHKEDCLSINGKQSLNLEKGIIESENYFKQLPVPFKIYPDFEFNLRDVEIYEGCYTKKYHEHVPCSYAYKVVCINDRFSKSIVVFRGKNTAYEYINTTLEEHKYCKKIMKKHFNKNLIMTEEEQHIRGAAHWNCNISFQLTKKIPVIFHNLKVYDSHLIFYELNNFDVKINVIPNGLEKIHCILFR